MKLRDIATSNLRRRKAKMTFLVLGLAIGVATVVALLTITATMKADINQKLDEYGANILIVPKTDQLSLSYGGMTVSGAVDVKELTDSDIKKITTIKNKDNISIIAPKIIGVVEVDEKKALLVGVDFKEELRLKKWWKLKGRTPEDFSEVILGSETAKKLKKKAGETLKIRDQEFKVSAVLKQTGSQEDELIFTDILIAQEILKKEGKLSLIEVSALCSTCPIETIVAQLSRKLPNAKVSAVKQAVQSKMNTLNQFTGFAVGISIVVFLIGILIVLTTMMSSVNERTREIGIFRSLGFRESHVMRIILFEAFVVSLIGGALGYGVGLGVAWIIATRTTEYGTSFSWNPLLMVVAILLSIGISELASLYPAIRASKLDPARALRSL